jgi:ABC-type amino acid transport substrate-binding protein
VHPLSASFTSPPCTPDLQRRLWLQKGLSHAVGVSALGIGLLSTSAAQAELADLKEKGSLKIALYKNNLPFSDANREGMTGVDAALAKELAKRLQLGVQWLPFEAGENMNDDLRNMVWRGHYLGYGPADVMLQAPIDKYLIEKTNQVEFLAPYYRHELGWLASERISNADLQSMSLDGLKLAAEAGTAAASALLGYGGGRYRDAVKIENDGIVAAKGVTNAQYPLAYVTRAQAESAIAMLPTEQRSAFRFVVQALPGTPPTGWVVGLAIRAGQPQLSQALQAAMRGVREDGTLARIYREHGLQLTTP